MPSTKKVAAIEWEARSSKTRGRTSTTEKCSPSGLSCGHAPISISAASPRLSKVTETVGCTSGTVAPTRPGYGGGRMLRFAFIELTKEELALQAEAREFLAGELPKGTFRPRLA